MKLDISAAWEDTVAMVKANREVLAILAALFFLLPGLALELFLPKPEAPAGDDPEQAFAMLRAFWLAALPYFLGSILFQSLGQLAITRLVGTRAAGTVGDVLREALAGMPFLILTQLLLGFGWAVLGAVVIGLPLAAHAIAIAVLLGLGLVCFAIWAGTRLSLVPPLVAIESMRNPAAILARSWQLTRGNAGAILLFLLLVVVVVVVASIVGSVIGGLVGALAFGAKGGELLSGIVSALISSLFTLYITVMIAAIYRQLAGSTDPRDIDTFS